MTESFADRARAAASARRELQPGPIVADDAARRRTLRVSGSIKYREIPRLNQQLSRILGEQVGLTWDWNVPVKAVNDTELESMDPYTHYLFLRARVDDVYIEAHASPAEPGSYNFFVNSSIAWGPLENIEDLGDHLLNKTQTHKSPW